MDGLEWKILLKWMIWGYPYFRTPPNILLPYFLGVFGGSILPGKVWVFRFVHPVRVGDLLLTICLDGDIHDPVSHTVIMISGQEHSSPLNHFAYGPIQRKQQKGSNMIEPCSTFSSSTNDLSRKLLQVTVIHDIPLPSAAENVKPCQPSITNGWSVNSLTRLTIVYKCGLVHNPITSNTLTHE